MRLMGLALVLGVGLCVLIVWDQTRPIGGDEVRPTREQAVMSQPAAPSEVPAPEAAPVADPGVSSPAETGVADGEVRTLVM